MTLLEQIINDRYDEKQCSEGGDPAIELARRQSWNAASKHIEGLVRRSSGSASTSSAMPMCMRGCGRLCWRQPR